MKYIIKVTEKSDGNYLLTYINNNNYTCTIERSELLRMLRAQEQGSTDTVIINASLSEDGKLKLVEESAKKPQSRKKYIDKIHEVSESSANLDILDAKDLRYLYKHITYNIKYHKEMVDKHTKDINLRSNEIVKNKKYSSFDNILHDLVNIKTQYDKLLSDIEMFNNKFRDIIYAKFSVEVSIGISYEYTISNKLTLLFELMDFSNVISKLNKHINKVKNMILNDREAYSKYVEAQIKDNISNVEVLNMIQYQSVDVCNNIIHNFVDSNLKDILQIHYNNNFEPCINDIVNALRSELNDSINCNIQSNPNIMSLNEINDKINYIRECTDDNVKVVVIKSKTNKHHTGYYETAVRDETVIKIKTIDDKDYIMVYEYTKYRYLGSALGDVNKEQCLVLKTSTNKYYIIDDGKISYDMTIIQNIKDEVLDKISNGSIKVNKSNLSVILNFFNIDSDEAHAIIENYTSKLKRDKLKI